MSDNERATFVHPNGNPRTGASAHFKTLLDENGDGRDPHEVGKETLRAFGHGGSVLKALRQNCIECQGGNQAEVRRCHLVWCPMWPYRMGSNPFHTVALSDKQRQERIDRLRAARTARQKIP